MPILNVIVIKVYLINCLHCTLFFCESDVPIKQMQNIMSFATKKRSILVKKKSKCLKLTPSGPLL